ncbi:hypothetical protein KKC44_02440 [Patescibacteria group bacterium]|nr:hypothetical protein [Patescibacteria group bacterium]MBU2259443.1 hypothetical protein [Patescibacteria group bacterium]
MRIFALETNVNKIKQRFCRPDEREILMTYYHGLSFLFAIVREILITIVLFVLGLIGWYYNWPIGMLIAILALVWVIFVLFNIIKAYIDWAYDFILITTDKVLLMDQTSFFHREIKPIHIENIGSVSTDTQFWNIFPFGILHIHLKEGLGGESLTKRYVPRVQEVAGTLSDVITVYQRKVQPAVTVNS